MVCRFWIFWFSPHFVSFCNFLSCPFWHECMNLEQLCFPSSSVFYVLSLSGRTYYVNHIARTTQWERPTRYGIHTARRTTSIRSDHLLWTHRFIRRLNFPKYWNLILIHFHDWLSTCIPYIRHTLSAPSGADIDAAAMEFERRFHISVDASENREQQVKWWTSHAFQLKSSLLFDKIHRNLWMNGN